MLSKPSPVVFSEDEPTAATSNPFPLSVTETVRQPSARSGPDEGGLDQRMLHDVEQQLLD